MPDTALDFLHPIKSLEAKYYYPDYTDKETKAQGNEGTGPRSQR